MRLNRTYQSKPHLEMMSMTTSNERVLLAETFWYVRLGWGHKVNMTVCRDASYAHEMLTEHLGVEAL